jgi:hypothetical protein
MILLPIVALAGGMRPIYQMSSPARLISAVIPSRWALEASMLQEAKAGEWKVALPPPTVTDTQECPTDIAQHNFPSCVIKVSDDKGERLVVASESALPPGSSALIETRHSLRESMTVLGSTLVLLIAAVIDRLRRRDDDPQ